MTPEKFIKKAIKGGWLYQGEPPVYDDTQQAPCIARFTYDGISFGITLEQAVLDPKAWEAVEITNGHSPNHKSMALDKMHRMIDALAEDKSLEEFLREL